MSSVKSGNVSQNLHNFNAIFVPVEYSASKPGSCPTYRTLGPPSAYLDYDVLRCPSYRHRCSHDHDCLGTKKCCSDRYGCRQCTCPETYALTCRRRCLNGYQTSPNTCSPCRCRLSSYICQPSCRNGGTCVATNVCRCIPPYTGGYCEKGRLRLKEM